MSGCRATFTNIQRHTRHTHNRNRDRDRHRHRDEKGERNRGREGQRKEKREGNNGENGVGREKEREIERENAKESISSFNQRNPAPKNYAPVVHWMSAPRNPNTGIRTRYLTEQGLLE